MAKKKKKLEEKEPTPIKMEVLDKMTDLATAGFGLVAAMAWNDAIKGLFTTIFPATGTIIAQFTYAAIVTAIIVYVTIKLGKLNELAKKRLKKQ